MIALIRFRLAAHLRSLRVLYPLIALGLLIALVLWDAPHAERLEDRENLIVGAYGDTLAFYFPIAAWAARGLLDTEPDVQQDLSWLAAGRRTSLVAGLAAAYLLNLVLGLLVLFPALLNNLREDGVAMTPALVSLPLLLLVALAATFVGAWTSRAVIPTPSISILTLLAACTALFLLGLGPLAPLALPILDWLKAAHAGTSAYSAALPSVALHLTLWSAITGTAYVLHRLRS